MKTIFLTLISFFTFLSTAQNPPILWQKNIGGSGGDGLVRLEIPNSTDYFLVGGSNSDISGDKSENSRGFDDIWILRLDQNHNILWDKTIGGDSTESTINSLIKDSKLYILCTSNSSISGEKTIAPFNTDGSPDLWLLCLDLNGNILWQNQYGGTEYDGYAVNHLITLSNGNLLLGTTSDSGISGNKTEASNGNLDYWVVEISSTDGSIINQNTIGSVNSDHFRHLFIGPNNTIVVTGSSQPGISGDKTDAGYGSGSPYDIWIVELDMNLNVIQDKCFGGTGSESDFGGFINYIDGYYYLITSSFSPVSGNKTAPLIGWDDYWLIKMDTNFNIIWDRTYGGSSLDNGGGVLKLGYNKLLLNGYSKSLPGSGTAGNKTAPRHGGFDAWLLIIDTLGNIIAQETYGGAQDDYITPASVPTNGVFYLSGSSESGISGNKTVPTNGGWDAWLMEIDASGFLNTESITGVQTTVSVFPNPTEGVVNVKFKDLEEDVMITFYSVDGKILQQEKIVTNSVKKEFDLSGKSQFVIYTIVGERINHSGRIVVK